MLTIKDDQATRLQSTHHPWVFSGALLSEPEALPNGALTPLQTTSGKIIGWGLYSVRSKIAVRMLSFGPDSLPADWLEQRIERACLMRRALGIPSSGMRLINSEGDFLPGLIIDLYGRTLVLRPLSKGMELRLEVITGTLSKIFPGYSLYLKRDEYTARKEEITRQNGYLSGREDDKIVIEENGLRFHVDPVNGQKTGYYLDQRDNRLQVSRLTKGKKVLNLFCYTGGFSLFAGAGGAAQVVSVDTSASALTLAEENLNLNQELPADRFSWIKADALEYLQQEAGGDLIILDPPPFARKKGEVKGALRGYKFINKLALAKISSGGILLTFSCSGTVGKEDFRKTIFRAGREAGRKIRMIGELHAAPDHPFSLCHPEGEYLKGWLLYVE